MNSFTISVTCRKCGAREVQRMELLQDAEPRQSYGEDHPLVIAQLRECERVFLGRGWARDQHEWFCPRCLPASMRRNLH